MENIRRNHQVRQFGRVMVFTHDMSDWLGFNINKEWLEENISWKDFETGVRLGKLKREDKCSLVLYDADSEVTVDAFMPHMHPGGEAYLVLEGEVWDDEGTYPTGSIVWMNRETTHTPLEKLEARRLYYFQRFRNSIRIRKFLKKFTITQFHNVPNQFDCDVIT